MDGIFHSRDLGDNWYRYNTGFSENHFTSVIADGWKIFAGTPGEGIYSSMDGGINWTKRNTGLFNHYILSLGRSGKSLLAGTQEGMFISDNDGLEWTTLSNSLTGNPVTFFSQFNTSIFSGSSFNGIVLKNENDSNWTQINEGLRDTSVNAVIVSKGFAYAGTSCQGVWRRPLEEIFTLKCDPDTLLLSQFSESSDTLFIHTSVDWIIIGTMPEWLTCEPSSGNGEGYVVFRTLTPNLSAFRKYASFFLYSSYVGSITFTIVQKEKSSGTTENNPRLIRVYPVPSTGIIQIVCVQEVKRIKIYNAYGIIVNEIIKAEPDVTVDLTREGPGVYFLSLEGEKWSVIRKIVIL
jgi:hypothetical protein